MSDVIVSTQQRSNKGVAHRATSRSSIVSFPGSRVSAWERGNPLHCESQKVHGVLLASFGSSPAGCRLSDVEEDKELLAEASLPRRVSY